MARKRYDIAEMAKTAKEIIKVAAPATGKRREKLLESLKKLPKAPPMSAAKKAEIQRLIRRQKELRSEVKKMGVYRFMQEDATIRDRLAKLGFYK